LKSSSQLFPVELVTAEVRENYFEDSYSLKPNNSEDKSVEIALIHLHVKKNAVGPQVLFVHDAFQSHWQWMESPYHNLITDLLESGSSIWLMDWRSHGSSKKNRRPSLNHIDEMATHDLSSVTRFVQEIGRNKVTLVAQGFGAQMVLARISFLVNIRNFVLIDAVSLLGLRRFWIPGFKFVKRIKLLGRRWIAGSGPEQEPVTLLRMHLNRSGIFARFRNKDIKHQVRDIQDNASKINWLCTRRHAETTAWRHTKKQSRIHKVPADLLHDEIVKLVSS